MTPRRMLSELSSRDLTEMHLLFELQVEEEKQREQDRKAVAGLKKKR